MDAYRILLHFAQPSPWRTMAAAMPARQSVGGRGEAPDQHWRTAAPARGDRGHEACRPALRPATRTTATCRGRYGQGGREFKAGEERVEVEGAPRDGGQGKTGPHGPGCQHVDGVSLTPLRRGGRGEGEQTPKLQGKGR